jgi:hypothetical protein
VTRANHLSVSTLRLCTDTVTLGSLPAECPEYRVMTDDIFGKNALAESNRIVLDAWRR